MKISEVIKKIEEFQYPNLKPSTVRGYKQVYNIFKKKFGNYDIADITSENITLFLNELSIDLNQSTKHLKFTQLKTLFNFCINVLGSRFVNPCKNQLLTKIYKNVKNAKRSAISKDTIDEMIYKTQNLRDRVMLELQARCGLRIGEVLKLKCKNINGRKITLEEPKSGNKSEIAFMPEFLAERIQGYIQKNNLQPEDRLIKRSYGWAKDIVIKSGKRVGIEIRPHDLRRHSATYASRSGVPIEIVSKIILRHQDLRTTQIYLGQVSDYEALHWIDRLYNK